MSATTAELHVLVHCPGPSISARGTKRRFRDRLARFLHDRSVNVVLIVLVVGSVLAGLVNGKVELLSGAMVQSAKSAVELALGLVGGWSLWLGLLAIVDKAGLMQAVARA